MGLLFLSMGCANMDIRGLLALKTDPTTGEQVVVGKLESVALSTQKALRGLGLKAVATPVGEAIHIQSETQTGAKFKLLLTRVETPQGERTRIHLVWEGKGEDKVGAMILATVSQ